MWTCLSGKASVTEGVHAIFTFKHPSKFGGVNGTWLLQSYTPLRRHVICRPPPVPSAGAPDIGDVSRLTV